MDKNSKSGVTFPVELVLRSASVIPVDPLTDVLVKSSQVTC